MRKGQSALEFLAYISILSIVFAGLHGLALSKQSDALEYRNDRKADRIGDFVSFQVEMALVQGDGYSRVFSLPDSLAGASYNVSVVNGTSIVEWRDKESFRPSRYRGQNISIRVSDSSNVFRVKNTGEVDVVEAD